MMLMSLLPGASALAAGTPSVTLTGSSITSTPGGTVSFTAAASNVSNAMYQFWVEEPNGTWVQGTSWQSSPNFTLSTPTSGDYLVSVNTMSASQVQAGDWSAAVSPANGSDGVFVNSSVTLTGNTTDVAVGQKISVTASASNIYDPQYQFWWQNPVTGTWHGTNYMAPNNSNGTYTFTFNAPVAGNYRMIAYAKSPLAVNDLEGAIWSNVLTGIAFGQAAMINLSPTTTSMAADGAATTSMTATVVDSNGNTVLNYNGAVGVVLQGSDLTPTNAMNGNTANNTQANPYLFQATNGVATIQLVEQSWVGSNNIGDTVAVVPLLPGQSLESGNAAKINLTAPQATYDVLAQYASLGPLPSVMSNANTSLYLGAYVADQNQVPLPLGYGYGDAGTITVSVSGPATLTEYNSFTGYTQPGLTSATLGLGVYSGAYGDYVNLVPNANASGMVTLTLSNASNGLPVGPPIQIMVVPPQNANSWTVTSSTPGTYTADQVAADSYAANNLSEAPNIWSIDPYAPNYRFSPYWTIQATDPNGLAVSAPKPSVAVTLHGNPVSNLLVTGLANNGDGSYTFGLEYTGGALAAGTYDVTVSEGLTNTLTIPVTITAGVPNQVGVTPAEYTASGAQQTVDVTPTNPSLTVTGQVEDILGNPVSAPGATLTFTDTTNSNELQLSGGAGSLSQQTVNVNSSGAASVTASAVAQGNDGAVTVGGTLADGASLTSANSATIDETGSLVSHLVASTTGTPYLAGSSYTAGASYPAVLITEENAANAPMSTGDTLNYTITSTNPMYPGKSGTVSYTGVNTPITVKTDMAGTYTVTVTDASNSAVAPVTATVVVNAGSAAGVGLFASGTEIAQDVPAALNLATDTNYNVGSTGTLSATANTPQTVWVHVTDNTGNIVDAPSGGVTVNLTTNSASAVFENSSGQVITQVTIPAGQNGVAVSLVDSATQSVTVGATYVPVATATFAGTSNGVATQGGSSGAYTYAWTVNVADQFGNPITGLTYADAALVDTSASPEVTYTGVSVGSLAPGDFTVTQTNTAGQYTITAESSTTVPTTDVAHITIEGSSINGTF